MTTWACPGSPSEAGIAHYDARTAHHATFCGHMSALHCPLSELGTSTHPKNSAQKYPSMNISYDAMQANRKDLQRFLGLNDDNEMVSLFLFLLGSKDLDKQTPMRPKNISDPGLHFF